MYANNLNKVKELLASSSQDGTTVFVATISPDKKSGNCTFLGSSEAMLKLFTSLVKLADQRTDGAILLSLVQESFSKGIVNIE